MAKSKKPRKKRNPNKLEGINPINILTRYSKEEGDKIKTDIHLHFNRMIEDKEHELSDYVTLKYRLTVGLELVKVFKEKDLQNTLRMGLLLLDTIKSRLDNNGHWGMSESEVSELRYLLELVDIIQDKTTRREQLRVFVNTYKDFSKYYPGLV